MAKQVEVFTRKQFEDALPQDKVTGLPMCNNLGVVDGEYVYCLTVNPLVEIVIRSSVKSNGFSAPSGEDSIRLWLQNKATGRPLAKKLTRWITRIPGWGERLTDQARRLYKLGKRLKPCGCGSIPSMNIVKKEGPNKGRLFAKCDTCNHFEFIES